jgi:hypothetical protein
MTHDSAPAAETSHSHTDASFTDTSNTSHDTWTDTSTSTSTSTPHVCPPSRLNRLFSLTSRFQHDVTHSDPGHSHHHHHHHHHHNHPGHGHNPLLDDQAVYPPPSYGSVINERDGRRPTRRRRQQQEEITFMDLVGYFLQGVIIIGFICFFGSLFLKALQK